MSHHLMTIHNILGALIEDGIVCEDNFRPFALVRETYLAAYKQALIDNNVHFEDVEDIMRKIKSEVLLKDEKL